MRTDRLVARPLAGEHFDELLALSSDTRVMGALRCAWSRRQTEANLAREIEHWRRHGFGLWAVHLRDYDRPNVLYRWRRPSPSAG